MGFTTPTAAQSLYILSAATARCLVICWVVSKVLLNTANSQHAWDDNQARQCPEDTIGPVTLVRGRRLQYKRLWSYKYAKRWKIGTRALCIVTSAYLVFQSCVNGVFAICPGSCPCESTATNGLVEVVFPMLLAWGLAHAIASTTLRRIIIFSKSMQGMYENFEEWSFQWLNRSTLPISTIGCLHLLLLGQISSIVDTAQTPAYPITLAVWTLAYLAYILMKLVYYQEINQMLGHRILAPSRITIAMASINYSLLGLVLLHSGMGWTSPRWNHLLLFHQQSMIGWLIAMSLLMVLNFIAIILIAAKARQPDLERSPSVDESETDNSIQRSKKNGFEKDQQGIDISSDLHDQTMGINEFLLKEVENWKRERQETETRQKVLSEEFRQQEEAAESTYHLPETISSNRPPQLNEPVLSFSL